MGVVYLVRHGQANVGRFNYDQLSPRGMEQAEVLGRSLRSRIENVNLIRLGTMQRHGQTLELIKNHFLMVADESSHKDWNEYDHMNIMQQMNPLYRNRWIMLADMMRKMNPRRDFERMFDKAVTRWMSGSNDGDYLESFTQFKKRTNRAFDNLTGQLGDSGAALVVTSGGVISSIIQESLGLPDKYFMEFNKKIVNGSVTKFVKNKENIFVSTVNDHSAFEHKADLITYI
ncbi:MAG: histidine phosphatase family protein [Bacteroidetes bacterium]|nr:histidine phosphatase family protein [Bacteroidota bacterium]